VTLDVFPLRDYIMNGPASIRYFISAKLDQVNATFTAYRQSVRRVWFFDVGHVRFGRPAGLQGLCTGQYLPLAENQLTFKILADGPRQIDPVDGFQADRPDMDLVH
jgi:hypothetical protein